MRKFPVLLAVVSALVMISGFALTACEKTPAAHEHQYGEAVVERAATCTEEGLKVARCTVEGCTQTKEEKIPVLGHDLHEEIKNPEAKCDETKYARVTCSRCDYVEENKEIPGGAHVWENGESHKATCEEPGYILRTCKKCGATDKKITSEELGHDWIVVETFQAADCTHEGRRHVICDRCDTEDEAQVVPKLGHDWSKSGEIITPPTCSAPGKRKAKCNRCGEPGEAEVPMLAHEWEIEFTVDELPTFDHPGSKSIHCKNCDAKKEETPLDQLQEGVPVEVEFRLVRNNGERFNMSGIPITILDEEGKAVSTGAFRSGSYTALLAPANYRAQVGGLPEGFSCPESFEIPMGQPVVKLPVTASVVDGPSPSGASYTKGSVIHDITLTTIDGETISFKQLLSEKKMILLNFFFTGCGPCEDEFPGLDAAYEAYKQDVALVVVSVTWGFSNDTTAIVKNYRQRMRTQYGVAFDFYFVVDSENEDVDMTTMFHAPGEPYITSAPTSMVIDNEGVICECVGHSPESVFRTLFEKYTKAPYYTGTKSANVIFTELPEAILPSKNSLGD